MDGISLNAEVHYFGILTFILIQMYLCLLGKASFFLKPPPPILPLIFGVIQLEY